MAFPQENVSLAVFVDESSMVLGAPFRQKWIKSDSFFSKQLSPAKRNHILNVGHSQCSRIINHSLLLWRSSTERPLAKFGTWALSVSILLTFNTYLQRIRYVFSDALYPYISIDVCKEVFHPLHDLAYPGIPTTNRLDIVKYFWPFMKKDINSWPRKCITCQKCQTRDHMREEAGEFLRSTKRYFWKIFLHYFVLRPSVIVDSSLQCAGSYDHRPEDAAWVFTFLGVRQTP